MRNNPTPPDYDIDTLGEIIRESLLYRSEKPNRVPPADSPNRPHLARLWRAASKAVTRRPNARTLRYAGARFGLVYIGSQLLVMHWDTRKLLVRPPTSTPALLALLGAHIEP